MEATNTVLIGDESSSDCFVELKAKRRWVVGEDVGEGSIANKVLGVDPAGDERVTRVGEIFDLVLSKSAVGEGMVGTIVYER